MTWLIKLLMSLGEILFIFIIVYLGHLIIKYKSIFAWIYASNKEKKIALILLLVFILNLVVIVTMAMLNNKGVVVG